MSKVSLERSGNQRSSASVLKQTRRQIMKASKSFSGIGSSLLMAFVMSICFITVAFGQVNNLPDASGRRGECNR